MYVFQMDGFLIFDHAADLLHVMLNSADPLAKELSIGLASLLAQEHVAITLGETKVATDLETLKNASKGADIQHLWLEHW